MNQVDPGRLTLYCQGPVRLASPGPSSAPMSILVSATLIFPARYQSSTFQWSSSLWISTGARRSATGRYIHVPWSLTMNRSTARSLQGAGIVRPAQHSHVFMFPVTGRSAAITPLGPQAAQAASASSTSVSGCGSWVDL